MSNKIGLYQSGLLSIASGEKLAVYSQDLVKVYQKNTVGVFVLLVEIQPDTEYVTSAFSAPKELKIQSSGAEALYQKGTDAVITERRGLRGQGAPGVLNATGALTAAMILSGIVTSAAATVAGTVPTGTVMDASLDLEIGESVDWSVIKTGANAFTVTAAAGHTLVGSGVVAATSSASFRTRKTAANTFVTYRLG